MRIVFHRMQMFSLGIVVCVFSLCYGKGNSGPNAPVVRSLAELNKNSGMEQASAVSLQLRGTVWWSNKTEGRIILKDETSVLQLELDLPCQMPALGDGLVLEGNYLAVKTRDAIKLSGVPVVDNNGLHPPEEKSGTLHLKAGRHPICVAWFDRTDRCSLDVAYEGPDLTRQKIPDEALFRFEAEASTGGMKLVEGLDYKCCEGAWWRLLPNFDHIPAVKTGVVDNFDIDVRSRDSHVGLQFSGFIEIPKDGDYTFHLKSDDGSRLFIGDSFLRVQTVGSASLPAPGAVAPEEKVSGKPEFQWLEIEGTVAAFHRYHGALDVDLMTKSGLVKLKVAEDSESSDTLRSQNRIRAVGVSRGTYNVDGTWVRGEFFVQKWEHVEQHYVAPQIWAEYPLVEIESLLEVEPSSAVDGIVHLRGKVAAQGVGERMNLIDRSGRILLDGEISEKQAGGSFDILGRISQAGSDLVLSCIHLQPLGVAGAGTDSLPLLTTTEEICQLSFEEAAKGYPVQVKGVIIGALEYNGAILHDSSRGIYLFSEEPPKLQVGDYCEVEGITGPFGFDPHIQVSTIRKFGKGMHPVPIEPTWDQLINGAMHCNYVEMEGVVASVKNFTVELLTRDGRINVRLNPIGANLPGNSQGAMVRLRGCLLAEWDGESRQVVVGSIFLDQDRVTVVHPAPLDPFDTPLKRVGDLLQFDPRAGALQRVKVAGQLVYQDEQTSYLMDGENGLRFIPVEAGSFQVGDRLEVVGFAELSGPSPVLRDAAVRRVGASELPTPRNPGTDALLNDEYDSTLVRIEGVLLGVSRLRDGAALEMQSGHRRFMALAGDRSGLDEMPKPGSQLELTGVYVGQGGNRVLGRPIDSFELLLNSGRDVQVLSHPPWWTLKRLVLVVALLTGVILTILIWVKLLHQKVEERTQQLGDQIRQRQVAERERAIEQERARLAHDLHDDLGAGLTEVNMLSSLVKNPAIAIDKKNSYADKMNELALHMVTSLDEIVWAENPRNDTVSSLAAYFESYTYRLFEPVSIGCFVDVADNLPDHPLNPRFRRGFFLAFKEALANVLKHAKASELRLVISVQGEELVVIVSDDGCGILSDTHEAGADGLSNMQARLNAMNGSCELQSDSAMGTTVSMRAPIQRMET